MQTGHLLANLLGISRQAVHAHFQSDNKDHATWSLTRIRENLTSKLHFHAGITYEARATLASQQVQATAERVKAAKAAWSQFDTTLRNGKRVQRQRDVKKAMQAIADLLGLDDDHDWFARMLRIAVNSLKPLLTKWCHGQGSLPTGVETRRAVKEITSLPLFMVMGDPPPQFSSPYRT